MDAEGVGSAGVRRPLTTLLSSLATRLLAADAATVSEVYRSLCRDLANDFGMDTCFLRHNDDERDATVLVAEWPPRRAIPDPDPLGVVSFADADPVFALTKDQRRVQIYRPSDQPSEYRDRVHSGSGEVSTTVVTVPLLGAGRTLGVLGFVRFADREWAAEEVDAVSAVGAMLAQVQRRVRAERALHRVAMRDELTGLLNRRSLTEHLAARTASGSVVGVLFVDIDRLAALNDFLGHRMGDRFLATVADRLRRRLPEGDVVARLGGDEFVVVLAGVPTVETALARAELVRAIVSEPLVIGDDRVTRDASVGVAVGALPPSELVRRADQAALQVKSAGGNGASVYSADVWARHDLRNDIELTLGYAISHDQLVLQFQPEVDLTTGRIIAVEALVRWKHPTRGLLGPDVFVPVADVSDLAPELGRWVVESACRAYSGWRAASGREDLILRVNVSPIHLAVRDFASRLVSTLEGYGIAPSCFCVELSEVAMIDSVSRAGDALASLRKAGVLTALDHFGVGYSSLLHLKYLSLDVLEIDRHFIGGLGADGSERELVAAMIALASSLRLGVVACGVESIDAARTLVELGCRRAQGRAICPPVDDDTVRSMLVEDTVLIDLS